MNFTLKNVSKSLRSSTALITIMRHVFPSYRMFRAEPLIPVSIEMGRPVIMDIETRVTL